LPNVTQSCIYSIHMNEKMQAFYYLTWYHPPFSFLTRCLTPRAKTTPTTKSVLLPVMFQARWHKPHPKPSFILLLLFQTSKTIFLLFLRWRKINMAPGPSFSTFMPALIEFFIILFPLRTRPHRQIPLVPSKTSGPSLTPPSFNRYTPPSLLTCWPLIIGNIL